MKTFYFSAANTNEPCEPYSQLACIAATLSMSFEMGTNPNFAGDYETKGCYAYLDGEYKGLSFYGTGGTVEQMQQSVQNPKWRPQGYDCNGE